MLSKTILLLFLIFSTVLYGQNETAQNSNSEEWSDTDSWEGGMVPGAPGCFDSIFIPAGVYIEIDASVNLTGCSPFHIIVDGEIHFQNGKKLFLPDGSTIVVGTSGIISAGNGGGNSNYIEIGGEVVWSASEDDITDPVVLSGPNVLSVGVSKFDLDLIDRDDIKISWTTSFEENNSHFVLERKSEYGLWQIVYTTSGAGNSNQEINYLTIDSNMSTGVYYYRLYQHDTDGEENFIGVRTIQIGSDTKTIVGKYSLLGKKVDDNYSGIVIILFSDGLKQKVLQ